MASVETREDWDLSFEGEARPDFVAGFHIATSGAKRLILGTVHEKLDFTATIQAIQAFRDRQPGTSGIYIGNQANGAAAIATLKQFPGVLPVNSSKSKYDRALGSSDELNAGNWYLWRSPSRSIVQRGTRLKSERESKEYGMS